MMLTHWHAVVDVFSLIFKGKIKLIHFLFWQSFNYWTVKILCIYMHGEQKSINIGCKPIKYLG